MRGSSRSWELTVLRLLMVFLVLAGSAVGQQNPGWTQPFPPYRVVGNVYYVGSRDLASFLITTPQGNILINSNLKSSVPQIRKSVEQLGFRFSDIKILLISHAHFDHCSGSALVKRLTGAKYMVMDRDVPAVEDGGRSDFAFGHSPAMYYAPTKVDRVLHDGDEVRLGGVVLVAHLTAGHTKGCTTWTLKVQDGGRIYDVVIVGSPNVLSSYKLVGNAQHPASYPEIANDFEQQFRTLKGLPCDVFLGAHGSYYGMTEKFALRKDGGANPFVDPDGYKKYVAEREQAFEKTLAEQKTAAARR